MQIFILLYIEAGSYINEEEDPWEFVVLWVLFCQLLDVSYQKNLHKIRKAKAKRIPQHIDLSLRRLCLSLQLLLFPREDTDEAKVCFRIIESMI
jgi:hypothetical protein